MIGSRPRGGRLLAFALLVAVCAPWTPAGRAAAATVTGRASAAAGWDSNPLEWTALEHRRGDAFTRIDGALLWADGGEGAGWTAEARWAAERYLRERGENRHLVLFSLSRRSAGREHWLQPFFQVSARFFPQYIPPEETLGGSRGNRDVLRLETGAQGGSNAGALAILWSARLVGLRKEAVRELPEAEEYETGAGRIGRSRAAAAIAGEARWPGLHGWQPFLTAQASGIAYERDAVESQTGGQPVEEGARRRDAVVEAGAGIARAGSPSLRAGFAYEKTWSNSLGVGFQRLRLDLSAGLLLTRETSAQLLICWHPYSRYDDEARLIDPYEDPDDPEFGERNRIVLGLRRPLAGGFAAEVQAGWHRNEAVVSFEDYEKTVYQIGLSYETAE